MLPTLSAFNVCSLRVLGKLDGHAVLFAPKDPQVVFPFLAEREEKMPRSPQVHIKLYIIT